MPASMSVFVVWEIQSCQKKAELTDQAEVLAESGWR